MTGFAASVGAEVFRFESLRELLAKASPGRAADRLAGLAAASEREWVAAQRALADVPLTRFLAEPLVDPDSDEVSRLIHDTHDAVAFAAVSSLTVGSFREHLLLPGTEATALAALAPGLTPENGGRRFQADAGPGTRRREPQGPGRHLLPHHARSPRPAGHAAPAEPPDRRSARHRGGDSRRAPARLR